MTITQKLIHIANTAHTSESLGMGLTGLILLLYSACAHLNFGLLFCFYVGIPYLIFLLLRTEYILKKLSSSDRPKYWFNLNAGLQIGYATCVFLSLLNWYSEPSNDIREPLYVASITAFGLSSWVR